MALTKNDIVAAIAARKRETIEVEVPEWGGSVRLRRLTAADLESTGMMAGDASPDIALRVLAVSLCDEEGEPLFGLEELRALDDADASVTLKLFAECAKLNGLMTAELEELVAGFGEAQHDGSSSS